MFPYGGCALPFVSRLINTPMFALRVCCQESKGRFVMSGAKDLDWVIVRENSEGEYAGVGGRVHTGLPEEVGMDVAVFTRTGVERIQRFALELARSRPRKN